MAFPVCKVHGHTPPDRASQFNTLNHMKPKLMTLISERRKVVAIHEAGHALFDWLRGCYYEVEITLDGTQLSGLLTHRHYLLHKQDAVQSMICTWGGIIAEARYTGEDVWDVSYSGGKYDYESILYLADKFFPEDNRAVDKSYVFSSKIVNRFWKRTQKIAALLEVRDAIDSEDVLHALGSYNYEFYQNRILNPALKVMNAPTIEEEIRSHCRLT
ncbi:hypothetical protein H6F89_33950 [Cyanobacteria bacterium FACHB-63]|nr:hypothetical protein [Cyanobacteria bacterium FACHB-63]